MVTPFMLFATISLALAPADDAGTRPVVLAQAGVAAGGAARGSVSPMDFQCAGDGVTDDSACFAAAEAASVGRVLELGPHIYRLNSPPPTPAGPVHLRCPATSRWGGGSVYCGLRAGAANLNLLSLPSGSTLDDLYIDMTNQGAFQSTAGAAITTYAAASVTVNRVWIYSPCVGMEVDGNTITINQSYISNVSGRGCYGIRIGHRSTHASTTDPRIINTDIQGNAANPPDADLRVENAGGLTLSGNDFLYGRIGTWIIPGKNQEVDWVFSSNSVFGDTTPGTVLKIDTADASAVVKGFSSVADWASSSQTADGVSINNSAGGVVTDIYFSKLRVYNNKANGVTVNGGANVDFDAVDVCGFSAAGVDFKPGVSNFALRNSRISPQCAALSQTAQADLLLEGGNANAIITGDSLDNATVTIQGLPTGNSIVGPNQNVENLVPTVPSANTLALNVAAPAYQLTGSAMVQNMTGFWNGRTVRLIALNGPISFTTGGGVAQAAMCNSLTAPQNQPITAWYNSAAGCWNLSP